MQEEKIFIELCNTERKKMKKKKEQTLKEKAWNRYQILSKFNSFGEPTYSYNIGDEVKVGNLQNCVIEEIKEDNGLIIYGFSHDANKNINKDATGREYMYAPWYNIRPIGVTKETNLTKENNIDIRFYNTSLESLLDKFYLHGVDMNPDYQRDYVWEDSDKESLLDSVFSHIEIGKFAFIKRPYSSDILYEVLDGKQRLSTLLDFYENRLSYKGFYFNELSGKDKYTFLNAEVSIGETSDLTEEEIYQYFYTLNKTGKTMDEAHLEKIKQKIEKKNEQFYGLFSGSQDNDSGWDGE